MNAGGVYLVVFIMNLRLTFLCYAVYFGLSLVCGSSECSKKMTDELLGTDSLSSCGAKKLCSEAPLHNI